MVNYLSRTAVLTSCWPFWVPLHSSVQFEVQLSGSSSHPNTSNPSFPKARGAPKATVRPKRPRAAPAPAPSGAAAPASRRPPRRASPLSGGHAGRLCDPVPAGESLLRRRARVWVPGGSPPAARALQAPTGRRSTGLGAAGLTAQLRPAVPAHCSAARCRAEGGRACAQSTAACPAWVPRRPHSEGADASVRALSAGLLQRLCVHHSALFFPKDGFSCKNFGLHKTWICA